MMKKSQKIENTSFFSQFFENAQVCNYEVIAELLINNSLAIIFIFAFHIIIDINSS